MNIIFRIQLVIAPKYFTDFHTNCEEEAYFLDLTYIRNLNIQKLVKVKHLYAAVCLLLVASLLMSAATYAWLVLSTAPEVSGVATTIGANGNLEIALSTANHLASIASTNMYEEEPFFEYIKRCHRDSLLMVS